MHRSSSLGFLGHSVEGTAVLEPLDLGIVESVVELDFEGLARLGVDGGDERSTSSKLSAGNVDLVQGGMLVMCE